MNHLSSIPQCLSKAKYNVRKRVSTNRFLLNWLQQNFAFRKNVFLQNKKTWGYAYYIIHVYCFSSVQLLKMSNLCNPMDCSMPGFHVYHQLLEPAQTQVYQVSDAIKPSYPLSSPSPPTFNLSQHQGLSSESVLHIRWPKYLSFSLASALPVTIQDRFPLGLTGLISLQAKELSRVFSNTTVQKHQFFSTQPSLWSSSHIRTWLLVKSCLATS